MATAGIGSNKESQIKYLRAQAEYDFAWVKYFDEICESTMASRQQSVLLRH